MFELQPLALLSSLSQGCVVNFFAEGRTSVPLQTGIWRSLVAHLVRDEGVAGSNPVIPTRFSPSQWPTRVTGWGFFISLRSLSPTV